MKITCTKAPNEKAWTEFMDMCSGGRQKLDWEYICIQGDAATARGIFEEKFNRDPDNVTCDCCGSDYSITQSDSLEKATSFLRGCTHLGKSGYDQSTGESIADFENRKNILIVYTEETAK